LPSQEDSCDCNSNIEPGTQVWTEGPEDPTLYWPPSIIKWDMGRVRTDTIPHPPIPHWEYVVDWEKTTGVVRITNYPLADGIIFVRGDTPPDTFSIPVLHGESKRFMPDGTIGSAGNVLVYPLGDVSANQDSVADLHYELWNLSADPVTYATEAEDADGWPLMGSDPLPVVPAQSYIVITVSATVKTPSLASNMVILSAADISDSSQTHWGACYVNVNLPQYQSPAD